MSVYQVIPVKKKYPHKKNCTCQDEFIPDEAIGYAKDFIHYTWVLAFQNKGNRRLDSH
jgi:hypothetical protein